MSYIYIYTHTHTHIELNNFAVHLKLTQHCKSTILQLKKIKINLKKKVVCETKVDLHL